MNRTETVNFDNADIQTWDLKKLLEKTILNYQLSLKESEKLKQASLNLYDGILTTSEGSKKFRPTLYDFLAHRAVDFFMNEEPEITKPAYAFEIDNPNYFSSYSEFQKLQIYSQDSTAMKFYALKLMQDLIAFHNNDKNPQALIDAGFEIKFCSTFFNASRNKESFCGNVACCFINLIRFKSTSISACGFLSLL